MEETTILVAFGIESELNGAAREEEFWSALNLVIEHPITEAWIAQDERYDRSDNESAVFVPSELTTEEARKILEEHPVTQARKLGTDHGTNTASWFVQGISAEQADLLLNGIENGDPAILDTFPVADLSGQWVDGFSSEDLARQLGATGYEQDYEDAFGSAVHTEVARVANATIDRDPEEHDPRRLAAGDGSANRYFTENAL